MTIIKELQAQTHIIALETNSDNETYLSIREIDNPKNYIRTLIELEDGQTIKIPYNRIKFNK